MIPKSFDNETCSELVGDATKRLLETKGRALADSENGPPKRKPIAGSYWSQVQDEAAYRVELAAYQKRVDRIARMDEAARRGHSSIGGAPVSARAQGRAERT